jgi:hypothetical protein
VRLIKESQMLSEYERKEVSEFLGRLKRDGIDSIFLEENPQMLGDALTEFSRLSSALLTLVCDGDKEFGIEDLKIFDKIQKKYNDIFARHLLATFCENMNDMSFVSRKDAHQCVELVCGLKSILSAFNDEDLTLLARRLHGQA